MKAKQRLCILFVIFLPLAFLGVLNAKNRLTYLEYTPVNESSDGGYIELNSNGSCLKQEFIMPYDIMHGFSVQIGTFARDNNSEWDVLIKEPNNEREIYRDHFNASLIADNEYYNIEFDKNIRLKKGQVYEINIIASSVQSNTGLAFWKSDNNLKDDIINLYYNNDKVPGGILCFRIYGGAIDIWWIKFTLLICIITGIILIRICILWKDVKNDILLQSFSIGIITFLMFLTFAKAGIFMDEIDNMRGGMIIARGGVLYKDYVTQHTPVCYYLCGLFALLGAASIEQFRISYYIFIAIIWGILYYRHSAYFGKKKMALLPVLEVLCVTAIIAPQGIQVLSDNVQGICMLMLLLECIRYYYDKSLDWSRCVIVSFAIWGSFGSAFISAFALIWVVLIVVLLEIRTWILKGFHVMSAIQRYWRMIIAILVPPICAIVYFGINHSLRRAVAQFYTFNREVYPKYGALATIKQSFISGFKNFFDYIVNNIDSIVAAQATKTSIIGVIVIGLAFLIIIHLGMKKRFVEAVLLFTTMCFSATRGYDFHGLAAWYIAVMVISLFYDELPEYITKMRVLQFLMGVWSFVILSMYVENVGNNLLSKQASVSEIESNVISMTDDGEKILVDSSYCDSIYFLYKNRYPVNRAVYMLPWYMDWYEQDVIDDLNKERPKIVIYNEDIEIWGNAHYANNFVSQLKSSYARISDDPNSGWKYTVWIRTN